MMNQIIRYRNIISFIRKNKPKKILEVGSGSKGIGKFMPYLKYTGLDKTTKDYGEVENKTSNNMTFIDGDVLNMPFEDDCFDFVFSLDMIEHIPKDKRLDAIKEMVRVSKKDIIIAFPYGKLGFTFDSLFYNYEVLKNGKVGGWLKEHIELGHPDNAFIDLLKNEFSNYNVSEKMNGNVFLLTFIYYLESVRFIGYFLILVSYIFAYLPFNFNSKYGIRKFLFIEKK